VPRRPRVTAVHLLAVLVLALVLLVLRGGGRPTPTASNTFGHGTPIVLVHGLGSTAAHWLPTARLLARNHRVTLVDLPGHGDSPMPEPFSLEQGVAALDGALADLGPEPVILVGHSIGGLVAAAEALEHPERVRGLVLIETALRPQVEPEQRGALLEALDRDYPSLLRAAYMDFGRDSLQGEQLLAEVAALDPAIVKRWIRLAWTCDLSAQIKKLLPPMLAVVAPRTWPHDESWETTAKAIGLDGVPHLRVSRIEGCGHFIMLDRPEELAAIIARFAANPDGDAVAAR
jgi:pimeloyl-ACP methyl ester carboxylesterase